MKIGFDAKRVFSDLTIKGIYSRFIIRALSKYHPENEYLLYTSQRDGNEEAKALTALDNVHLRSPSSIVSKMNLENLWGNTIVSNVALKDGVHIFHGLNDELPFILSKNFKTVVTIHDLLFLRYPEMSNFLDVEIYKRKLKHACKVADKIVAVSKQTADDLNKFLEIDKKKVHVIYQGCSPLFCREYSPLELNKVIDKYKLPDDFILHVGTIDPRRNSLLIIKALAHVKTKTDVPLVIVGKPTKYKNELVRWATKENILERIIFIHDYPYEDLPKIYQLAKLFVYPSKYDGFSLPLLEAMSSKVPVITSKGTGFAEVGGGNSLYVDSEDYEELGDAILSVLHNPSLASKMIMHGQDYISRFSEECIASDMIKLYQSLEE